MDEIKVMLSPFDQIKALLVFCFKLFPKLYVCFFFFLLKQRKPQDNSPAPLPDKLHVPAPLAVGEHWGAAQIYPSWTLCSPRAGFPKSIQAGAPCASSTRSIQILNFMLQPPAMWPGMSDLMSQGPGAVQIFPQGTLPSLHQRNPIQLQERGGIFSCPIPRETVCATWFWCKVFLTLSLSPLCLSR